jgi:hypothetical protein
MSKIFVVTSGEYSDYGIDAMFTSMELAQKFIDSFKAEGYSRFNKIEIYKLNPFEMELREGYNPYFLRMDKEGNAYDISIEDSAYGFEDPVENGFDIQGDMYIHCFAKDEAHAVKICNERRVQLIESDKWSLRQ